METQDGMAEITAHNFEDVYFLIDAADTLLQQGNKEIPVKLLEEALVGIIAFRDEIEKNGKDMTAKMLGYIERGLRSLYMSELAKKAGAGSFFAFEKLLQEKENPAVVEYTGKNKRLETLMLNASLVPPTAYKM